MGDIRVERTMAMLEGAFEELLEEKHYDRISVSELCERATVRRGTFYKHFQDKDAFLKHYLTTITDRLIEESRGNEDLTTTRSYASYMFARLIVFCAEHRRIAQCVLGRTVGMDVVDMAVDQVADGIEMHIAEEAESRGVELPASPHVISDLYSAGIVRMLRQWMQDGQPPSGQEMVDQTTDLLLRMCGF